MNDFQSSINTISEEDLDKLIDGQPLINIDENNLVLGKEETLSSKGGKSSENTKNPIITSNNNSDIPFINAEDVENLNDGEEEKGKEGEEDTKKEEKIKEEPVVSKKDTKVEPKEEAQPAVTEVLKNTVNFLVDKGLWQDFEGREEFLETLDEESYAELASKQLEYSIQSGVQEELNSTGDYGKAILEYAKNGGNPDEVIDLFKEQKSVEAISIDSEDGQKSLIEKYYTEVFDWSKEKAKKYINTLITSDELEPEAKEVEAKYQEHYKGQLQALKEQQAEAVKQSQEEQKKFVQTINNKLSERKDFTDADRKLIQNAVFRYDQNLSDGTKVNSFYLKFAEMQKNPDDYLDLVKFVMDKKGYDQKVKKIEQTKDTDKKWSFVKGNAAINKNTVGSKHEELQSTKKLLDLDFSNVLHKK